MSWPFPVLATPADEYDRWSPVCWRFPKHTRPGNVVEGKEGQLCRRDSRDSHHAHEPCERNGGESSPRAGAVH